MNYKVVVAEQERLREWWQLDNERREAHRLKFWRNVASVAKVVEVVTGFCLVFLGGVVVLALSLCTGQAARIGKR